MKMLNSMSFHLLTEPKFGRTKRITIWPNGYNECYVLNINPKNFRSWIAVLIHVTRVMQPNFGAVRKLIALSTMKVIDCFEDLSSDEKYVALGINCRFKPIVGGYTTPSERNLSLRKKSLKKFYIGDMNSKTEPFLIETKKKKLTIVFILVNGRTQQTAQKVVLNEKELSNWSLIYNYLTKILDIPEGIKCICTIFGQVLQTPHQFQHGYLYVAVPSKESFICIDYTKCQRENRHRSSFTLGIRPASLMGLSKTWSKTNETSKEMTLHTGKTKRKKDHVYSVATV